jgi:outer membrane cobalamin receptor
LRSGSWHVRNRLMRGRRYRWSRAIAAAFAVAFTCVATAQEVLSKAVDVANFSIEELMNLPVTTFSKREEKLSEVPGALHVITQDDIRRSGVFRGIQDTLLEDIERIEVIRGPGATLWGANAVNGVINIITKKVRDTQGFLLSGGAGTEGTGFGGLRYGARISDEAHFRVYGKVTWRF